MAGEEATIVSARGVIAETTRNFEELFEIWLGINNNNNNNNNLYFLR